MKNFIIVICCLVCCSLAYTQTLTDIDLISPFHDDLSAIKKGAYWGFMDRDGVKVIEFRDDLVIHTNDDDTIAYPKFYNGRCIFKKLVDGEYHYGYIDRQGKEIIAAQYLNVTNFINGFAIIATHSKDTIGYNEVLGMPIFASKIEEYIIDTSGKVVKYLDNSRNFVPSNVKSENTLRLKSKFIAPGLVAVKNKNEKWEIHKF